jgi:hypothetical protein
VPHLFGRRVNIVLNQYSFIVALDCLGFKACPSHAISKEVKCSCHTRRPSIDLKCQPKSDQAMLLTRKASYGLIAVKHLTEQPRESSFSAKDQRTFMDFPI